MVAKEEVLDLLKSTESYSVERTTSTGYMDKLVRPLRHKYRILNMVKHK